MLTTKQFFAEAMSLRNMWGQKTFWMDEDKVRLALKAIAFSYLNTKCEQAESEMVASLFDTTIREFTRRALYVGIYL